MRDEFLKYKLIPFKDGGRDFKGCDCWGLVILIFKHFGIEIPDFKIACGDSIRIDKEVNKNRDFWKKIENPIIPCAVVMRTNPKHPKLCNHIGVYYQEGWIIHTFRKMGVTKTAIDHPYFKYTIEGFYVPS